MDMPKIINLDQISLHRQPKKNYFLNMIIYFTDLPCCAAINPIKEKITNPAKTLVPLLTQQTVSACLKKVFV